MKARVEIFADADRLALRAAEIVTTRCEEVVRARGVCCVSLAGGSTPRALYELLSDVRRPFQRRVPWESVHFFWGDERGVSPTHHGSNYRMAREAMLAKVPVPRRNVHRMKAEVKDLRAAACAYEKTIARILRPAAGEFPRFDLILLGLGVDGHTASLFPESPVLWERARWVLPVRAPVQPNFRLTLTLPVINNAAQVLFLVTGEDKADAIRRALGRTRPAPPARFVYPERGETIWLLDRAASGGRT